MESIGGDGWAGEVPSAVDKHPGDGWAVSVDAKNLVQNLLKDALAKGAACHQ